MAKYPTVNIDSDAIGKYSGVGANPSQFSVEGKQTLLRLNKYYGVKRDRFYVKNNGETMFIQFEESEPTSEATIRGEKWDDEYVLSMGILFWGSQDSQGSQHTINSRGYSLELQLIHFSKKHKKLETAAKKKAGILVTCVLFEAVGKANTEVQPLARAALSTTFPHSKLKQVHGPLDLKRLFPNDPMYFQYVAPTKFLPCSSEATWIVFRRPLPVSTFQLSYFRGMRDNSDILIGTLFDHGDGTKLVEPVKNVFVSSKLTLMVVKPVAVLKSSGRKVDCWSRIGIILQINISAMLVTKILVY